MKGNTHLFFGISTSSMLVLTLIMNGKTNFSPFFLISGSAIGSLLPDIDLPLSKIGRKFSVTSQLINKLFNHRLYVHDLLFFTIFFSILCKYNPLLFGLGFGYIGHLILDGFTIKGITFGYIFNKKSIHFLPKKLRFKSDSDISTIFTFYIFIIIFIINYYINLFNGINIFNFINI